MNFVHDYGVRFLKYGKKKGMWVKIPLNVASRKAIQALREGRPSGEDVKADGVVDKK